MLMICILLAAIGMVAYLSRDEIFISGANLTISVLTLLLLPILQATQNRDGAALQTKIVTGRPVEKAKQPVVRATASHCQPL
jgi:low affinity Fe/Cu permease